MKTKILSFQLFLILYSAYWRRRCVLSQKTIILYLICLTPITMQCCKLVGELPTRPAEPEIIAPLPMSSIGIPITIDISSAIPIINASVTSHFNNPSFPNDDKADGHCYKFEADRQKIDLSGGNNNTFSTSTQVFYKLWGNAEAPIIGTDCTIPVSCGTGKEWPRIINASYVTSLSFKPDYSLDSNTPNANLSGGNKCEITGALIDITGKVISLAKPHFNKAGDAIDKFIEDKAKFNSTARLAMDELSKDIKLTDGLYLRTKPQKFFAGPINISEQTVNLTLGVLATPEIVTQPNPNPVVLPLPDLDLTNATTGFNIYTDIRSGYKFISDKLNETFSNHRYSTEDPNIYIDLKKVEVFGIGQSSVTFQFEGSGKIKVKKYKKCIFYVTAKPVYDAVTQEIRFTNVSVDSDSKDLFVKAGLNLFNFPIVQGIQEFKLPVKTIIDNGKNQFNNALNQEINQHLTVSGNVNNLNGVTLHPRVNEIIFRANLSGSLNLTVKP